MSLPVLDVAELTKSYGEFKAVDALSFTVEPGEVLGFLGPNGAGKTSTMRMILGLLKPDAGAIRLFGAPWSREALPRLGYLPEERGLYKRMRAVEAVVFFARLKGLPAHLARRKARDILDRLGLAHVARTRIENLSRGLAQKVQVAAAIAHEPDFLILDEPFSGLDPLNQQVIEDIIRDQAKAGRSAIFSTHTMQHAERLCRRIIILRRGRKAFEGTIAEARRLLPRRVRLDASVDLSFLAGIPGVGRLEAPGPGRHAWEAILAQDTEPGVLLAACVARGVTPTRFDASEPTLHEVFVAVAGGTGTADIAPATGEAAA
jgi:ABC-2 type transport system ATP-binding protein